MCVCVHTCISLSLSLSLSIYIYIHIYEALRAATLVEEAAPEDAAPRLRLSNQRFGKSLMTSPQRRPSEKNCTRASCKTRGVNRHANGNPPSPCTHPAQPSTRSRCLPPAHPSACSRSLPSLRWPPPLAPRHDPHHLLPAMTHIIRTFAIAVC